MKKTMALALALSFTALLAMVPDADARRKDDAPHPPECQVEDGGVLVCR